MTPDLTDKQVETLQNAVENNQQNSPTLSIDPKSERVSVVGDPNNLHPTKGEYKLKFEYDPSEVSEKDKPNLTFNEKTGKYIAEITYTNCRLKPAYRTQVLVIFADILVEAGVLSSRGYTVEEVTQATGRVFLNHIPDLITMASLVLGESKERLENAPSEELVSFFSQFMENEPNILNEAHNFLASSSSEKTTEEQNQQTTTQN